MKSTTTSSPLQGVRGILDDAVYASERIPDYLTAHEAALEFCNSMFSNLREANEADGAKLGVPTWFVR
jgi:hypothetical protein